MILQLLFIILLIVPSKLLAMSVEIDGLVNKKGIYILEEGSRLNDLFKKVSVREDVFYLGASWARENKKPFQLALKTGLLFDLKLLSQQAALNDRPALGSLASQLHKYINTLPVTGRIVQQLDPAAVIQTRINHLLQDGDKIYFPERPVKIHIIGALDKPCTINFNSMKTASYYLQSCPIDKENADKDYIFIIQADGSVTREGIALWNRTKPVFISPGATILVPISYQLLIQAELQEINVELANFLATQTILPGNSP